MDGTGAPAVGDRCRTTRRIGGAERPSTSELARFDPPRTWSVHGIDGPIRAQVDLDVVPLSGDRARVTIAIDFQGAGIGRLLVPLVVRRQARAEMPENMTRLKQRIEAEPHGHPERARRLDARASGGRLLGLLGPAGPQRRGCRWAMTRRRSTTQVKG